MKLKNIDDAHSEAVRFIKVLKEIGAAKLTNEEIEWGYRKQTAALRRASLDLTRALAKMRNER